MPNDYDTHPGWNDQPHRGLVEAVHADKFHDSKSNISRSAFDRSDMARPASILAAQAGMETVAASLLQQIEATIDLAQRRSGAVVEVINSLASSADKFSGCRPPSKDPSSGGDRAERPEAHCALAAIHDRLSALNMILADMPVTELADQAARFEGLA